MTIYLISITTAIETLQLTNHHKAITTQGKTYRPDYLIAPVHFSQYPTPQADSVLMQLLNKPNQNLQNAQLEIFDYTLQTDIVVMPARFYGKITQASYFDTFTEIYAVSTKNILNTLITRTYAPVCQAVWGDNRCGIDKSLYKEHIQISNIVNDTIYYTVLNGNITNTYAPYLEDLLGNIIPITTLDLNSQTFITEPFYVFEMGQTYNLYAGCTNTQTNCVAFENFANYLGF